MLEWEIDEKKLKSSTYTYVDAHLHLVKLLHCHFMYFAAFTDQKQTSCWCFMWVSEYKNLSSTCICKILNHTHTYTLCNTYTPHIKRSFRCLNVVYHNRSSPGMLQLPRCTTTSQRLVVQLSTGMNNYATTSTGIL